MSPRLVLSKTWAEAQGACATAVRHSRPEYHITHFQRNLSSFDGASHSEAANDNWTPYTRDFRSKGSRRARRIFSLVQPTGIPHLGNYLGALRSWKDFQDEKDAPGLSRRNHVLMYGIADLHSLTSKQDPAERRDHIRKTYASLLAIGLDPGKSNIFLQSDTPAHAELMWILSNVASTGYLSRMTQWKEKIGLENPQSSSRSLENLDEKSLEKLKLSLFSYPVLQAADILLYGPDTVPVGEDQAQHVEFTRKLARSFNSTYCRKGEPAIMRVPELLLSPAKRVMSLSDPTKKMSKSDADPMSRVLITDTPEEIQLKFKKAKTDSIPGPITYSHVERPGVSNLIDIYKHIKRSPQNQEALADEYRDLTLGALKAMVADAVIEELQGVREKYLMLMDERNATMYRSILDGRKFAGAVAGVMMLKVRRAVGLYTAKPPGHAEFPEAAIKQTEERMLEEGGQDRESVEDEVRPSREGGFV